MNKILRYEMIVEIHNKGNGLKKSKSTHKNQIAWLDNGRLFENEDSSPWLSIRPKQTRKKKSDTPIFAIFEDGSRKLTNTHHFFRAFSEPWIEIKADVKEKHLQGHDADIQDIENYIWNEEREDRPNIIKFIIPAETVEQIENCFSNAKVSLNNGNPIRSIEFRGEIVFCRCEENYKPILLNEHPGFMSNEEYDRLYPINAEPSVATKAAKSALRQTPKPINQTPKFEEEEQELIVVAEEELDGDDVNELFEVSHAKPPAPVGDFGNDDFVAPKNTANLLW